MEVNKSENQSKNKKSPNKKQERNFNKTSNNSEKDIRFIQTNFYLNDFNYYYKNNLKMNKLRQEKIKEHKKTIDDNKKINTMPKMLYFNKFIHSNPKIFSKKNMKTISDVHTPHLLSDEKLISKSISKKNKNEEYKTIELAIKNKSIEQNSKRHIKKTIKAFDDLLQCVDGFKINDRKKRLKLLLGENNNDDKNKENSEDDEEDINIENYNFDEYKKKFKDEKMKLKENVCKTEIDLNKPLLKDELDIEIQSDLLNSNNNDNIYLTQNYNIKGNKNDNKKKQIKKNNLREKKLNKSVDKKFLTINNMIMISDESLANKIKSLRKNFKKDLYFNRNNYGKYKFTELGLNYPLSFNKYKKYPDYNGNDLEERRMFNYKSKVSNPNYNYTNIGSFNDKFNKDLSGISNFYGKEQAKGRFIRNPLISMFSKYIPNYEMYKDLKFIENRYTHKNKYKFKLKSLVNNSKNNFDRLANIIYKQEHKAGYFE